MPSPESSLFRRRSQGSPHPENVKNMLEKREAIVVEYKSGLDDQEEKVNRARIAMKDNVQRYIDN